MCVNIYLFIITLILTEKYINLERSDKKQQENIIKNRQTHRSVRQTAIA